MLLLTVNLLGVSYRPLMETLCDHFAQMIDDGLLKRR